MQNKFEKGVESFGMVETICHCEDEGGRINKQTLTRAVVENERRERRGLRPSADSPVREADLPSGDPELRRGSAAWLH